MHPTKERLTQCAFDENACYFVGGGGGGVGPPVTTSWAIEAYPTTCRSVVISKFLSLGLIDYKSI